MIRGAFIKPRAFSETLVAATPYIILSLAVAVGFKAGLFNIGVEGQFFIGAITAAYVGQAFHDLPAIIHLPLTYIIAASLEVRSGLRYQVTSRRVRERMR